MSGSFNPNSLLSMIPLDAIQGLKPWVGLTANTLMIGGIIDVLPFCKSRAECWRQLGTRTPRLTRPSRPIVTFQSALSCSVWGSS